jgi:hypothetical protein
MMAHSRFYSKRGKGVQMKTRRFFNGVILALVLALFNISTALATPPLPSSFYGTVKLNGANVPSGTAVTARCNGVQYSLSPYNVYLGNTVYSLNVPGDDPATLDKVEGCVSPTTVSFYIGDFLADQRPSWNAGTNVNLNLSYNEPTAVPLIISGDVGIAGATILYTGGSTTSNAGGIYSFTVDYGWVGTVTPSLTGYTFTPPSREYVNVTVNRLSQDYIAAEANPPVIPSSFYGTVKSNAANVPVGVQVSARINGHIYATSPAFLYNGDTVYSLNVPGDDLTTLGVIEGGVPGDTIVFLVSGTQADQTATWQGGTNINLNLTAAPPIYLQIYLPLLFR